MRLSCPQLQVWNDSNHVVAPAQPCAGVSRATYADASSCRRVPMTTKPQRCILLAAILLVETAVSAYAVDEIQVYNAEIAKVGQWTFQLHLNYAFVGREEPDFPGGLIPNHALNGTGEW